MSLSFDEARAALSAAFQPLPSERRPLLSAMGLAPARDLCTDRELPPFDRVAMDGYAVRAADTVAASQEAPVRLRVVGAAYAGGETPAISEGQCARAMTGAPLPAGADAVVPVEWTAGYDGQVACIHRPIAAGANFAPRGEDCVAGARIVAAGTRLRPEHLQALASTGHSEVEVHRPPRAIVFATGDELVPPEAIPRGAQIRESNGATIRALLAGAGIPCTHGGIVRDEPAALRASLEGALAEHELLLLSGGVSRGERDHVIEILDEMGAKIHFESLKLRPGHPATFATLDGRAVFALPGNPVAVVATLCGVYGVGLRRWMGVREEEERRWARLDFAHLRRGDRTQLLPVRLEALEGDLPRAVTVGLRGSGDFFALAQANALALLRSDREQFAAGDRVEILPLRI